MEPQIKGNGSNKILYFLISGVFAVVLMIGGALIEHTYRDTEKTNSLLMGIRINQAAADTDRSAMKQRLNNIEKDVKEINERIRKLY